MHQHRHDDDHEAAAVLGSVSSRDLDLDLDLDPDLEPDLDEGSRVSFAALAVEKLVSPARGTRQGALLPGVDNHVVRIWGDGVDVVVRTPRDTARPDTYPAEEWAAEHAARHGVRTPRVLARESEFGEGPLMIVEHVTSIASDRDPWHDLGRLAAALAEVPLDAADPASVEPDGVDPHVPDALLTRFGRDLPEAWRRHVRYGLDSLVPGDRLLGLGVYTERQRGPLGTALEQLVDESGGWRHGLVHGDLAPRNLVPRGPGDPVLIDWGTVRTGPVPWLELDRVHRWSVVDGVVTADELRRFADGVGVDLDDYLPTLRRLALLHHLDLVRWALEHRPERLAREVEEARRAIARCLR